MIFRRTRKDDSLPSHSGVALMARRITGADGAVWEVAPSGRHTQYGVDELTLEFARVGEGAGQRRFARFSPGGAKAPELALDEASDRTLTGLLATSQPAWTSPDGGYKGSS